ncbi:pyridoxal phosphate-dependent decarboxylase family protein [Xanthomonas medicagonis]|uniref:pyridoxal phosphate-dependent decarboxylase family protein n=1 Tax=Xanthomonas medicagonis TaxID=3160841 RepID=UPI003511DBB1
MTRLAIDRRKTLPEQGLPWNALQDAMSDMRSGDADWRHGRTPLHVYYAGEDVLDVARRAYAMFINENALAPAAFPSLQRMQDDIIDIALSLLGGGARGGGSMTSGGTESIILAVRSALRAFRHRHPRIARPRLLLPTSAHPAYDKAADLMQLDVLRVPIGQDYRADVEVLAQNLTADTLMIVASAPSLPFGVIDPVESIARLAREHGVWLHVDACIGGFLAPHVAKFKPGLPRFDLSVPGVRSLSADLHKFGYSAKGASVILYADAEDMAYQHFEYFDWPKGMYRTQTLTGTRPGGTVAAAWAVLHYLGENGYRALAQRVMRLRDRYIAGIRAIPDLHLFGEPDLSVIAYGSQELDIHGIGDAMQTRGWYVSRLSHPPALHMTVTPGHDLGVDAYLADLAQCVHTRERGKPANLARTIVTY